MTTSPRRTVGQTLRRAWLADRSLLVLAAVAFLLADAVIVFVAARGDFAIDFTCCYQQAGQRLLDDPSTLYAWTDTYTFRYSPWAAVLFTPLAGLSETVAVWLWLALKVAVVAVVAVGLGRRWSGDARWLVTGIVLFFPPIWHDLALGNVSVFTVAVLAVLLARRDGMGSVAFG
ncbi:MAG: glycosyltransferase 87 family protein, partial [Candidatus Limnocylindria bacterium]